jgi:membrane protease YdiL (CAAX protease family)
MQTAAIVSQYLLLAVGVTLLWRHVFSPAARAQRAEPRLQTWDTSLHEVGLFLFHALAGAFAGSLGGALLARTTGLAGDPAAILATAGLHTGMLAGMLGFLASRGSSRPRVALRRDGLASGTATFLMAMPFVFLSALLWTGVLKGLGLDTDRQPAVEMVGRIASSPWIALFVLFAVIVAPIAEELLFRAGLFRYLRTRQRRWAALLLPALLFAAIHFHLGSYLPLAVLGVFFSLAYERTGNVMTPIVAHALFNLNNLLVLLAGGVM